MGVTYTNLNKSLIYTPAIRSFCDGSAYLSHMERIRKARGATLPESFKTDPLMYQAVSDKFLESTENIYPYPEEYGLKMKNFFESNLNK